MALELIAPAKLNLTLEVLARRPDGYHEIVSVMQTIDLCDRIRVENSKSLDIEVNGEQASDVPLEASLNLAYCAAVALRNAAARPDLGASIRLEKQIPAGLGLGGGSSDAAAVLRGLNRLWNLKLDGEALARVAARIGSDVPFFMVGGTAVVGGHGEQVRALPDVQPFSPTLFLPDLDIEEKTRRMYGMLTASDFTKGEPTRAVLEKMSQGPLLSGDDLINAFDGHIGELAPSAASAMAACRGAGLEVVAAGSGPGFFTLTHMEDVPPDLLAALERDWGVSALAATSLNRMDATALSEV